MLLLAASLVFCVVADAQDDTVLRDGDRFAQSTFTEGVYLFTVEDESLTPSALLPPGAVRGDIVVLDALPDGNIAIAGINTQLSVLDTATGEVMTLSDLDPPGGWWESIDFANDLTFGVFDVRDLGLQLERGTYSLTFDDSSIALVDDFEMIHEGQIPAVSFDGLWLAYVTGLTLNPETMPQWSEAVEVLERETGEVIFSDGATEDRTCTRPRFHPGEAVIAYVCKVEDQTHAIVYDLESAEKTEVPIPQVNACVRWSPEGERLLVSGAVQDTPDMGTYLAIDLETVAEQTFTLPEDTPDYDPLVCMEWLFPLVSEQ
jgi:hypothetical protein